MKKFTSLLLGGLLALTVSASAALPQVILNNSTNYEVSIDGRVYNSGTNTLQALNTGIHRVEVYTVTSGGILGIGKKRALVSSSSFNLSYNDVFIDVNSNGSTRITERRTNNNGSSTNGGYGNGTYDNNNDRYEDRNGRGHAYGKYKHNKGMKEKKDQEDNDRYEKVNKQKNDKEDDDRYENKNKGKNSKERDERRVDHD